MAAESGEGQPDHQEPEAEAQQALVTEEYARFGKYRSLLEDLDRANGEFGEDLWLIAERIILYRLTRAGLQKRVELATLVHAIRGIISELEGVSSVPPQIEALDKSAEQQFRGESEGNLREVFSAVVDAAEGMNVEELYKLIAFLRKAELPREAWMNIEPLERAQEYLSQSPYEEDTEWTI